MTLKSRLLICSGFFLLLVFTARSQDSLGEKPSYKNLTVAQFNNFVNNKDKTVLVNFSADWCVVCKRQKPILDELSAIHKNDLLLLEIDMEENPLIAEFFEVDGLPINLIYT